jgi:hypothetical protein
MTRNQLLVFAVRIYSASLCDLQFNRMLFLRFEETSVCGTRKSPPESIGVVQLRRKLRFLTISRRGHQSVVSTKSFRAALWVEETKTNDRSTIPRLEGSINAQKTSLLTRRKLRLNCININFKYRTFVCCFSSH